MGTDNGILNVDSFKFSDHAIKRFQQRTGESKPQRAEKVMRSNMKLAKKAIRKNFVKQFFKYGQTPTEYYITRTWVFVVKDNVVMTCYQKDWSELKKLFVPIQGE
jgi:hypothetical protein